MTTYKLGRLISPNTWDWSDAVATELGRIATSPRAELLVLDIPPTESAYSTQYIRDMLSDVFTVCGSGGNFITHTGSIHRLGYSLWVVSLHHPPKED